MIIIPGSIVTPVMLSGPVSALCCKPYPGHPKGCPNFNHKPGCPPTVAPWQETFSADRPVYAIINQFDFAGHVEKMHLTHPQWSQRQLECCLYWQQTARKELNKALDEFELFHGHTYFIVTCPEAHGMNVTETVKPLGIELEWPPEKFTYQVALAGVLEYKMIFPKEGG